MNPPPNPFWDFVNGMEDHPFFAQSRGRPFPPGPPPPPPPPHHARPEPGKTPQPQDPAAHFAAFAEATARAQGKQPEANAEDPPEVDPSTLHAEGSGTNTFPFRGRGRFAEALNRDRSSSSSSSTSTSTSSGSESGEHGGRRRGGRSPHGHGSRRHHGRHGPHGHGHKHRHGPGRGPWGGRGGHDHRGPPPPPPPPPPYVGGPFMFGSPFHGPQGPSRHGPGPHPYPHHAPPPPPPPPAPGSEGHDPFGWSRGRGGCPRGRFGRHGPHSRSPPHGGPFGRHGPRSGGPGPFDLGNFLTGLGERLGVDLTSAAEGLGLDVSRFTSPRSNNDSDFEPRTDIFDTPSNYTIHISVPGAKKSDVGVEWDGEHSTLRVTGVVHRPGVDEEMMSHLVVDGRKRETGVFEKNIRLGTNTEPAAINVSAIAAKMADGILVVTVPKIEKKPFQKKEVRIGSPVEEKDMNMDEGGADADVDVNVLDSVETGHDHAMYNAEPTHQDTTPYPAKASASASSSTSSKAAEKQKEAEQDAYRDDRSETIGPNTTVDTLPRYEPQDNSVHDTHQNLNQNQSDNQAKVAHEEEMSDWEKAGSDDEGEGEFIKINVD